MKNDNISIEIAKQLYDLGLRAFALEYWIKPTDLNDRFEYSDMDWNLWPYDQGIDVSGEDLDGRGGVEWAVANEFKHPSEFWDVYAAYNFSEIRAIVPHNVEVNENVKEIGYKKTDRAVDKWGKLLIWLLRNDAITLTDIENGYA